MDTKWEWEMSCRLSREMSGELSGGMFGGNFLGKTSEEMSGSHDYQSLRATVMICAILVNT